MVLYRAALGGVDGPPHLLVRADAGGVDLRHGVLYAQAADDGQAAGPDRPGPRRHGEADAEAEPPEGACPGDGGLQAPQGPCPFQLLEPWYRARSFTICHNDKLTDELFSRDIVYRLKQDFTFLLPYYDYFVTLEGDPDPRDAAPV